MSVVNANSVTFDAGAIIKISPFGTSRGALSNVGLLGKGLPFNAEQRYRSKTDNYPEVIVAQAIQLQSANLEGVMREWRRDTLLAGLGLQQSDITETAGGDTAVVAEPVILNANDLTAILYPRKISVAMVVKNVGGTITYVLNTDYRVIDRDLEGRTVIQRIAGGAIAAGASLEVSYTYTSAAMESYPIGQIGQVRYKSLELIAELTNGGIRKLYIPKCTVAIRGGLNFLTDEDAGDLPFRAEAVKDSAFPYLALLENINPA